MTYTYVDQHRKELSHQAKKRDMVVSKPQLISCEAQFEARHPPKPTAQDSGATLKANITVAINYSLPLLDRFISHSTREDLRNRGCSQIPENPFQIRERASPRPKNGNPNRNESLSAESKPEEPQRRSKRQRKPKKISRDISKVRYDFCFVPCAQRNKEFLKGWRGDVVPGSAPCPLRSGILNQHHHPLEEGTRDIENQDGFHRKRAQCSDALAGPSRPTKISRPFCKNLECPAAKTKEAPFVDDSSVFWVPASRTEWDDCVEEMTNLCTTAERRKYPKQEYPPIAKDYIRDRIDIDDPIRGFQIRHKEGGWLQGFVLMTTFTTWTHYFKWDSKHPKNGLMFNGQSPTRGLDYDGSLSHELEQQYRSGNPLDVGVIWPSIAEISLVGGIGCGEYLVRVALDDLMTRDYDYVVVQATDTSKTFYEKFGFIRVGAVSKYGAAELFSNGDSPRSKNGQGLQTVGYRHWTYADETSDRLNMHGGPSIMMALRLRCFVSETPKIDDCCADCGQPVDYISFLEELSDCFVYEKPTISPLNSTLSLGPGRGDAPKNLDSSAGACLFQATAHHNRKRSRSNDKTRHENSIEVSSQEKRKRPLEKDEREKWLPRPSNDWGKVLSKQRNEEPVMPALIPVSGSEGPPSKSNSPRSVPVTGRSRLRKQVIPSMYRDPKKTYFFNKVVAPRDGIANYVQFSRYSYYFVLNYDEELEEIQIIPLVQQGTFVGKREGRTKWKATVIDESLDAGLDQIDKGRETRYLKAMGIVSVPCSDWKIIPAKAVTKCARVAEESWDVLV